MRKNSKTLLTTATVLAVLSGGFIVYSYAGPPSSGSSGGMMGGMMQGGQGGMPNMMGMMNMMGQMSQMMETCNNMMKEMPQHHGPEKPEERKNLEQQG